MDNYKVLDINGDGRVEKHEIKQMVKLTSPDANRDRAAYLAEVGKFKDLMRDCNKDDPNDGHISVEEGIECIKNFVMTISRKKIRIGIDFMIVLFFLF